MLSYMPNRHACVMWPVFYEKQLHAWLAWARRGASESGRLKLPYVLQLETKTWQLLGRKKKKKTGMAAWQHGSGFDSQTGGFPVHAFPLQWHEQAVQHVQQGRRAALGLLLSMVAQTGGLACPTVQDTLHEDYSCLCLSCCFAALYGILTGVAVVLAAGVTCEPRDERTGTGWTFLSLEDRSFSPPRDLPPQNPTFPHHETWAGGSFSVSAFRLYRLDRPLALHAHPAPAGTPPRGLLVRMPGFHCRRTLLPIPASTTLLPPLLPYLPSPQPASKSMAWLQPFHLGLSPALLCSPAPSHHLLISHL